MIFTGVIPFLFYLSSDIDECSADPSPCDENADCTNSDGSYSCTCKQGFTGNGTACEGRKNVSSSLKSTKDINKLFFYKINKNVFFFSYNQISMSVLRIPVRVMKTLIVPTVTDLTAVFVNKDSLEMAPFVKV